jgi:aryl-alcohol dehydrogenase-like predicted oxidoreductase
VKYAELGNTGLFVSRLCLGGLTFGNLTGTGMYQTVAGLEQKAVNDLVERALDAGVNLIDTANVYSDGQSEVMVGQALKDLGVRRSDVIVATKFFSRTGNGPNDIGASRSHIMTAVEQSLTRLDLDYIDLYQMHGQESVTPDEEFLSALDDLVSGGKIRYIGCSNWQAWKLMKALAISQHRDLTRFQSVQSYYSIAGRDIERELSPLLQDQKVGLMVWGALAWGLLSGKYSRDGSGPGGGRRAHIDYPPVDYERAWNCIDEMRDIGDSHGVSVARVALAWILAQPFVTTVIVGAKNIDQLNDNLAALDLELSVQEIERLDKVSALSIEYPGWAVELMNETRLPKLGNDVEGLGDRLSALSTATS